MARQMTLYTSDDKLIDTIIQLTKMLKVSQSEIIESCIKFAIGDELTSIEEAIIDELQATRKKKTG